MMSVRGTQEKGRETWGSGGGSGGGGGGKGEEHQ